MSSVRQKTGAERSNQSCGNVDGGSLSPSSRGKTPVRLGPSDREEVTSTFSRRNSSTPLGMTVESRPIGQQNRQPRVGLEVTNPRFKETGKWLCQKARGIDKEHDFRRRELA